jgi:hypothetical protein
VVCDETLRRVGGVDEERGQAHSREDLTGGRRQINKDKETETESGVWYSRGFVVLQGPRWVVCMYLDGPKPVRWHVRGHPIATVFKQRRG